jgi:hypothetical protein
VSEGIDEKPEPGTPLSEPALILGAFGIHIMSVTP